MGVIVQQASSIPNANPPNSQPLPILNFQTLHLVRSNQSGHRVFADEHALIQRGRRRTQSQRWSVRRASATGTSPSSGDDNRDLQWNDDTDGASERFQVLDEISLLALVQAQSEGRIVVIDDS